MCNGVVKYSVSVSTQMQVLAFYSFWYLCVPNLWYSPARLFRSPSLQPFVHLAPDLLARHEGATDAPGAQLLPPRGLVYSLTAAEVVTLPSRKMERKYALRRRSPGDGALSPTPPFAFFRGKRRRTECCPNQRL